MGKFILADNQELTRLALISLIKQDEDNTLYVATDRAGLVELLKEHEDATVLLDFTLFDFADAEQLLIIGERFTLSQWILISDELTPAFIRQMVYSSHQFSIIFKDGPLSEVREALQTVSRHQRYISQRALEVLRASPPRRLPPNASPASIPSPPTAKTSSANWASTPPTKSSNMPFVPDSSIPPSSTYKETEKYHSVRYFLKYVLFPVFCDIFLPIEHNLG